MLQLPVCVDFMAFYIWQHGVYYEYYVEEASAVTIGFIPTKALFGCTYIHLNP